MSLSKCFKLLIQLLIPLTIISCDFWTLPEIGNEGQPCDNNGGCYEGFICSENNICLKEDNNNAKCLAEETCNGVDDNCNGSIDEGVKNKYYKDSDNDKYGNPNEKMEACKAPEGYVTDNSDCNDSNKNINPNADELCNSIDDNCNKQIDETFKNKGNSCDSDDEDRCSNGILTCKDDGTGLECTNDNNITEQCDGEDNDCDEQIDEGCSCDGSFERICSNNIGECKEGKQYCVNGVWGECDGVTPKTEICDGKDNNCDSHTDEDCDCINGTEKTCSTDVGTCRMGKRICSNGEWGECDGVLPQIETCDDLDNNCDGNTDEGFEDRIDCKVEIKYILISAGSFKMGSLSEESGRYANEEQHDVTLTYDFEIQNVEVTQGQFKELMNYNPSYFTDCGDDCPVETVNWHEALAYCNKLSENKGYGLCYDCTGTEADINCSLKSIYNKPQDCPGYRLPTEAEWEYAARAKTTTAFYNGDITNLRCNDPNLTKLGWYCGNADNTTHPEGQKAKNEWGLYDMLGNVSEWNWSFINYNPDTGELLDTENPESGNYRILRGGSWSSSAQHCRTAYRYNSLPNISDSNFGFRVVKTIM